MTFEIAPPIMSTCAAIIDSILARSKYTLYQTIKPSSGIHDGTFYQVNDCKAVGKDILIRRTASSLRTLQFIGDIRWNNQSTFRICSSTFTIPSSKRPFQPTDPFICRLGYFLFLLFDYLNTQQTID